LVKTAAASLRVFSRIEPMNFQKLHNLVEHGIADGIFLNKGQQ